MTAGSALIDRRYSSQENRYVLMLRLPKFRYFQPETLSEAVEMMADGGPDAMFVAGGTDLYPNMKRRQQMPKIVIGLAQLQELRTIKGKPKEEVVLGAGLTLSEVFDDSRIQGYRADLHALVAQYGQHRGKPSARHAMQLLRPELRVAEGHPLLHEERRRDLLGGSLQPALLGGPVQRLRPRDGGDWSEGKAGFELGRENDLGGRPL